tara:strand:+ start:1526 stop:1840 length:315 start_codon:yes stop_codon:yes gene_type:complete
MWELNDKIEEMVIECLEEHNVEEVNASKVGLDRRAGTVFVCSEFIACQSSRSLDYYGGFEYVDEEDTIEVGSYKFYANQNDNRVTSAIEYWEDDKNNAEGEDES